jgi:CarD family transcriptional regulator
MNMFRVGDSFIYGKSGICELAGTREMSVCCETRPYYVLKPVYEKGLTVYVPVGSEESETKMRRLFSPEEIYGLIAEMPHKGSRWVDNENERKEQYKTVLAAGDRTLLVRLMRTVFLRKQKLVSSKKKLHVFDELFLKDAEKMLYDEFAYVLGLERKDVLSFILARIEKTTKQRKGDAGRVQAG